MPLLPRVEREPSQGRTALTLDNGACDAYAQQLQFVNSSVAEFKPSEHKMPKSKKEKYKYTIEEYPSKQQRGAMTRQATRQAICRWNSAHWS